MNNNLNCNTIEDNFENIDLLKEKTEEFINKLNFLIQHKSTEIDKKLSKSLSNDLLHIINDINDSINNIDEIVISNGIINTNDKHVVPLQQIIF